MSSGTVNIASGYLSSFERPISVSVMSKAQSWPFLQQLGFAGSLTHTGNTFHGLSDFKTQMAKYSSTSAILQAAWRVIKQIVPNNPQVMALMYTDPALGQVGKDFQSLSNFGQVFAVSPSELKSPSIIASKVSSLA
jgi:hypothetical protein